MYLFSDNIPRVRVSAAITLVSFTVILKSHTIHRLKSHTIHRLMRGCVWWWEGVGGGGGGRRVGGREGGQRDAKK